MAGTGRALVIGPGAFRGSYDAGVLATLARTVGPGYFDAVYASSVGAFAAAFFVAGQPRTIEDAWRHLAGGRQVFSLLNPLRGRRMMNLRYLTEISTNHHLQLDIARALCGHPKLTYVVTDYETGAAVYLEPTAETIFQIVEASAALPFVHGPVTVAGRRYLDGSMADPIPVRRALADGYGEVWAIYNKPPGFQVSGWFDLFAKPLSFTLPRPVGHLARTFKRRIRLVEGELDDPRVSVIRPSRQLPLRSIFDTEEERIHAAFDRGCSDAHSFLASRGWQPVPPAA